MALGQPQFSAPNQLAAVVRQGAMQAIKNVQRRQHNAIQAAIRPLLSNRVVKPLDAYVRQMTLNAVHKQKTFERKANTVIAQMKRKVADGYQA